MYTGIIDKDSNPFSRESWIDQICPLTQQREIQVPVFFKLAVKKIRSYKQEFDCVYPAFITIRWEFEVNNDDRLLPILNWNQRE
jgi:hypothetical protein